MSKYMLFKWVVFIALLLSIWSLVVIDLVRRGKSQPVSSPSVSEQYNHLVEEF